MPNKTGDSIEKLSLKDINPARRDRFANNTVQPVFARLRAEDPVHYTAESEFGPYWSLTRWDDIRAANLNYRDFTSREGIDLKPLDEIRSMEQEFKRLGQKRRKSIGFITMDPPEHTDHRKSVAPGMAPSNLRKMEPLFRQRAGHILDALPYDVPFDWVDCVSKELTATVLATLLDFPFDERRRLIEWSDILTTPPGHGVVESWAQKAAATVEFCQIFEEIWEQRKQQAPGADLISMMAHNSQTANMTVEQFRGTMVLLLVGGNDTTRNTITGSLYYLNKWPEQYEKLRRSPELIKSMIGETLRYHTPISHMSRVATRDVEIRNKLIRKGDRVVMWYLSGNHDPSVIDRPEEFLIDRKHSGKHLSFGVGVHACIGSKVAEMQLSIIWEELLSRFPDIKVLDEPERAYSNHLLGFERMNVVIPSSTSRRL